MNPLKLFLKTTLFLATFFWVQLSPAQQFDIGGEIGNPFRQYISPSGSFGTLYPKAWDVLENHSAVSFIETSKELPNAVGVTVQVDATLQTPSDLARKLLRENPTQNWRQIDVNGRAGFLSEEAGRGSIFVLTKPGTVIVTRFQTRPDSVSKEFVRKVIYSVKTP